MRGLPLALLVLVLVAAIVLAGRQTAQPVYTVAQVRAGLAHGPRHWAGRTILVRGRIGLAFARASQMGIMWWLPIDCTFHIACLSAGQIQAVVPAGSRLHLVLRSNTLALQRSSPLLVLLPPPPNRSLVFLQRLPVLGRWLHPPAQVPWGAGVVYRINILPTHITACQPLACDDAALVDVVQ